MGFIAQCYEEKDGELVFNGSHFESGMVANTMPAVGDAVILPLTKKCDHPRSGDREAFKIVRRIIQVDPNGGPAMVRLVVVRESVPTWSD